MRAKEREDAAAATARMESDNICVICMEAPANGRVVPCGHQMTCFGCALQHALSTRGGDVDGPGGGPRPSGRCSVCRGPVNELLAIASGGEVTRSVHDLGRLPGDVEAATLVVSTRDAMVASRALVRDARDITADECAETTEAALRRSMAEVRSRKVRTVALRRKIARALANGAQRGGRPYIAESMGETMCDVLLESHMAHFSGPDEARSVQHLRQWLLASDSSPPTAIGVGSTRPSRTMVSSEVRELRASRWRALVKVLKDDAGTC